METGPKSSGKVIPVEIENVRLRVDFKPREGEDGERLEKMLILLERMRKTFGENVLLEELTQLVCGSVEKITITGMGSALYAGKDVPNLPVPREHVIVSDCPWRGYQLKQFDPDSIEAILNDPSKLAVLSEQDKVMMRAYVSEERERKAKLGAKQTAFITNDGVDF